MAVGGTGERAVEAWFTDRGFDVESVGRTDPRCDLHLSLSLEIKTDLAAERTGRVAVEIAHHGRPSGLSTSTAAAWCFVVGETGVMVPTWILRTMVKTGGYRRTNGGDYCASTLVLIPLEALKAASGAIVIDLSREGGER